MWAALIFPYWRFLPEGPAKYHAYLRSRDWLDKRRLVARRSRGWCEDCHRGRAREVHHLDLPAHIFRAHL